MFEPKSFEIVVVVVADVNGRPKAKYALPNWSILPAIGGVLVANYLYNRPSLGLSIDFSQIAGQ